MRLSDGTVVGLCCGFSQVATQLFVVVSAREAAGHLKPDRAAILKMIGLSFFFAIPFAAAIWLFEWVWKGFDDRPEHGLHVSVATLLAIAWAVMAIGVVATTSVKRIKRATGVDVLSRSVGRAALMGVGLSIILSGIYIFGGHLLRT